MQPADKARVASAFAITSAYYARDLPDVVARMYQADLDDLPAEDVLAAIVQMRRQPKRRTCPLPAEVRAHVQQRGTPDAPELIAARITGAIARFGRNRAKDARAYIGESGWVACQAMGGWADICSRLQVSEIGTFAAQTRDLCKAEALRPCGEDNALRLEAAPQSRAASLVSDIAGKLDVRHATPKQPRRLPRQHVN